MSSVIEDFLVCQSEALLESCTKEQLVQIAERFSVDLTSQEKRLKETIVTTLKRSLVDRGVIEVSTELITPSESFVSAPAEVYSESETTFPKATIILTIIYYCRAVRDTENSQELQTHSGLLWF